MGDKPWERVPAKGNLERVVYCCECKLGKAEQVAKDETLYYCPMFADYAHPYDYCSLGKQGGPDKG